MTAKLWTVGDPVVVVERRPYFGKVTKVARKYITVNSDGRTWEFDKLTCAVRGEHCGYIPRLRTPDEHALIGAWERMTSAFRSLPYNCPSLATLPLLETITETFEDWAKKG